MDWLYPFAVLIGSIITLMGLGLPVAFAFFATNILGALLYFGGTRGITQMVANFNDAVATYALAPLPMFLVMGSLYFRSGLGEKVIHALDLAIGNLRGRLSYVVLSAGAIFAALSGSSLANAGMMGSLMAPEMLKRKYKPHMAYGPILGAGSLAVIIPPSALGVLLGSLAQIDVGALLIAGVLPGLLLVSMYAVLIWVQTRIDPKAAPQYPVPQVTGREKLKAVLVNIIPMGFLVFMVVGTIILGIATPTESAGLGCAGVVLLLMVYRKFSFAVLWKSLDDAMKVTAMTFLIISASMTFSQIFAFSGASNGFIQYITGFDLGPHGIVLMMVVTVLILGMFMDQVSMMLITLPLFMPIASQYGFDTVWLGLILLLAYEVGFTTPPFGMLLFVVLGVAEPGTSLKTIAMSALPYVLLTLLLIVIIMIFPQLALFLPSLI
ncbi:MAG: C4-dicarboxylate ABC transporter permease [Rhodobacterales bacterium 65-51]|uniref:TRAP transporter large permease n=1 Tax=uncultured Gemmobacter sp. TaxID=1095917 RepID=UPI000968F9D3|nr:TRAP transporter large permease subunit [uncultured Gemmobacter sp.]OJY34454.1 MAG: C4-dicarboxylate ABC transporter permease [Rhodobacterales bacterium 65-51]